MKSLSERLSARGFAMLRVATLEVLYRAKKNSECIGPAELSKRAGIFREPGYATKQGNDQAIWGVLNSLVKDGLVTKCAQNPDHPDTLNGWELEEELYQERLKVDRDLTWGGDRRLAQIQAQKQWGFCVSCFAPLPKVPDVDHVVASAQEGPDTHGNKQLLCPRCNRSKGVKNFGEFVDILDSDALKWTNYWPD